MKYYLGFRAANIYLSRIITGLYIIDNMLSVAFKLPAIFITGHIYTYVAAL